ncbi:MAG: NADH-quinone oxidoreductase subunit NuoF [Candidatus Omnitrophica bacterium]|nr:NADH-quinone oxidoreductase subunit NuoF [Candidatus Omnitrophota bacterium]
MRNKKTIFLGDSDQQGREKAVYEALAAAVKAESLDAAVQLVRVAETGKAGQGVVVRILPENIDYVQVKPADAGRIIGESVKKNKKLEDLTPPAKVRQIKIVLRNCGRIDPERIEDYIAGEGYQALKRVLSERTREEWINEMKLSGLRGRGGGGFPTWMKWNFAYRMDSAEKYVICNGDEGDPGAYMDRSVLEGDPHAVVEGMMIAGYLVGAQKGIFYIRAEYPLAIKRIQIAIDQARSYGLLGERILGGDFSFDLQIRLGAGAFVCGEETALIASIEGKRGCPKPRPPYPTVSGLWGKPTVINNVETLANVAQIILRGGAWFAGIGSPSAKGTKVFALTGKVKRSGLIEVPMGITLRQIVFEIGGGVLKDKRIKAVQTGGPSGGVIPEHLLDTPVDYENLQKLGSIMGSGGMIVMDEDDCMVDISKFYLGFCVDESCGKCAPCRIGGVQMLGYLRRISEGKASMEDVDKMERICAAVQRASLCGLGQTAPNPVLSTLKYFRREYVEHIKERRCGAKKCASLLRFTIIQEACKRCGMCLRACPVAAITRSAANVYTIDPAVCVKCGKCYETCKFAAIKQE